MIIKRITIEKCISEYAMKLLDGSITIEDFLFYFEKNPKSFKYFNAYAYKHLYTTLGEISDLKKQLNNFHIRIYIYQLFQGYLFSKKIKFEIKVSELVFFYSMQEQCPEWFQSDFNALCKIFPNLEELVNNKTLNDEIVKLCQIEKEYPVWLQNPSWIIEDNIPLCFVSQSDNPNDSGYNGEEIVYKFKNKNNEYKYVTQYD